MSAASVREQVCSATHLPDRVTGKDGKNYPALTPDEAKLLKFFRSFDDEMRKNVLIVPAGHTIGQVASSCHLLPLRFHPRMRAAHLFGDRRLDLRLKKRHTCTKDPNAGFIQIAAVDDRRQWECLGCGEIVTLRNAS